MTASNSASKTVSRRSGARFSLLSRAPRADAGETLSAEDVYVRFGGVTAVAGVDLTLARGEILGLIGPNGAGKTTLLNALSGFQRLAAGRVKLGAREEVTGVPPHRLARRGIARTFQSVRLFRNLTVLRNVELSGVALGLGRLESRRRAYESLERIDLVHRADALAGALPFGEERRVALARAFAARPAFLLLDEPAAGLNELETPALMTTIDEFRRESNCGVLLVEHDMQVVMRLCERIQVLDSGKTIASGTPREVQADRRVIEAYLGVEGADALDP